MEIDVNEFGNIRLKKVYNPLELVSSDGQSLVIHMREGGFEIGLINEEESPSRSDEKYRTWYVIQDTTIERLGMSAKANPISGQEGIAL